MKKVLLFSAILSGLTSVVNAQISKGSVLLGGGIFVANTKSEIITLNTAENSQKHLTFNPSVGVAIKENLVFGITLGYGRSEGESKFSAQTHVTESKTYGGGAFLRKYLPLGKGFYFFGQGGLNYTRLKNTIDNFSTTISSFSNTVEKGWDINLNVGPGLSYAVHKKFHLEAGLANLLSINYGKSKENTVSSSSSPSSETKRNFGFNSSASSFSNFNIGFRFLFAK